MATSDVEIVNMGLGMIGESSITAMTDDSDRARVANLFYDRYRDATLRSHFWNGAMKRAQLAKLAEAPTFGFANAHQLPSDFIRLRAVKSDPHYRLEGSKRLLSDQDPVNILYVYRVTDPGDMGDLYSDALATRLASAFAGHFENPQYQDQMWRLYIDKLQYAQFIDSAENQQDLLVSEGWTVTGREVLPAPFARTDI